MLHIVLHEPEIPFNTGAIGRTCVATHTSLHMIRPYGFVLDDRHIRRAGMDYWPKLELHEYLDYEDFLQQHPELCFAGEENIEKAGGRKAEPEASAERRPKLWFATTKAHQVYSDVQFGPDDYLMFGKESAGIPEEILAAHPEACIRIPMWGDMRSLNLSNSAAILLYEAYRQNDFEKLERYGELHRLSWKMKNI